MGNVLFETPTCVSPETVDCEEDLKPTPRKWIINGPPEDGRCECCGKHISELKPFGGPGDPLAGDFSGALLIKKWRLDEPPDKEAWMAVEEAFKGVERAFAPEREEVLERLISKFGKEKGEEFCERAFNYGVGKSWECRDCACLDTFEYFDKWFEAHGGPQVSDAQREPTEVTDSEKPDELTEDAE